MARTLPGELQPKPKKAPAKQDNGVVGWVKSKAKQLDSALRSAPPIGTPTGKPIKKAIKK